MPINRKNSLDKRRKPRAGGGRPAKSQLADTSAAMSESSVENASAGMPSPEARISFFITQAQKAQLREKGYSDDEIAQMKPAEAHHILGLE
jgi:hypothetical protein